MDPKRAEAILRCTAASLEGFANELSVADSIRPAPTPAIQHVIVSIRQCRLALLQLLERS